MIALKFNSTKDCMAHLLLSDTFDNFNFIEGEIVTFNTFTMDGFIQKAFFDSEENLPEYSSWKNMRDYCFSLIKGKKTPLSFKFIFSLSPRNIASLIEKNQLGLNPEDVQGLYMNFRYDGQLLQCITGASFKTFSMDKTLEHTWDTMVQNFLSKKEIDYEVN